MTRPQIGIIGFGDFSKLLIRSLQPYADIVVSTREERPDSHELECRFVDVQTALSQHIVIPCMPAQNLEDFFATNAQHVPAGTLVVDVCSVKVLPTKVLLDRLPESVSVLATHPLFGPASAADGLQGHRIMMHPARIAPDQYEKINAFVRDVLQLRIIECSPEEHDKTMAYVQGLSHYIGRVMQVMDIPQTDLTTAAYDDLLDMKRIQGGDSWELFESIMHHNPYAVDVHDAFLAAIRQLDERIQL